MNAFRSAVFLATIVAVSVASAQGPEVYSLDPVALAKVKASLDSKTSPFRAAYQKLVADADKAMNVKLVSVVDKSIVPPSGDKRDYMSQSRYWWPDASKPDGRPYIRRDGETNPEIEQLPDHGHLVQMASTVSTLSLAYYYSGNGPYARRAAQWIRHWFLDSTTGMRPNLQFAQGIPGRSLGRGPGVLDGRHTAYVIDAVGLIRPSGLWTESDDAALRAWFSTYVTWLTESAIGRDEQNAPNNHGTWYDAHVLPAALYGKRIDIARRIVEAVPSTRILSQIAPDGTQPKELARTRPFHYSIFNLEAHARLAMQARRLGIDLWSSSSPEGQRIRAALNYLLPYARGTQAWPHEDLDGVQKAPLALLYLHAFALTQDRGYFEATVELGGARLGAHRDLLLTGIEPPERQ